MTTWPSVGIVPYHESRNYKATRAFYARVLKLEEGSFGGGYIGFGSGRAQPFFAPPGAEPVLPDIGIDVGSRAAVNAAHTEAMQGEHEVPLRSGRQAMGRPSLLRSRPKRCADQRAR